MIHVAAAIIFNEKKVLIAKRAAHKYLSGFWEFPGGKIETNETPENCLFRELDEELQITVKINSHLMDHIHDYGDFVVQLNVYLCTFLSGEFTLIDHDEIQWVSIDQLLLYRLAPADIPIVEFLMSI